MLVLLKLVLVPALIGTASLAGRRWGHGAGGWVAALPIIAGPIVLIMTLEHGVDFGARAAQGTLLGLVAVAAFCVVYARLAERFPWPVCLAGGWCCVALASAALARADLSRGESVVVVLAAIALAWPCLPRARPAAASTPRLREIGMRMAAGVAMVLVTTALAERLGSRVSGLAAAFPVGVTVMAVFSQRFHGVGAVVALMRALVPGLASFAAFFLACALALEPLGTWPAFGVACAAALAVHAAVIWSVLRVAAARRVARARRCTSTC